MGNALALIIGGISTMLVFGVSAGKFFGISSIAVGVCRLIWLMLIGGSKTSKGEDWMKKSPDSKCEFSYGEYGLAVAENQLHLCEYNCTKSYAFNEVQSWKTNSETGGQHCWRE